MRPWFWTLILVALLGGTAAARDVAVVVNKGNATKSVALADLVKLVKGTTKKWADNKDVTLVLRDPGAAEMRTVVQKLYGMSADEVKALAATLNQARKGSVIFVGSDDLLVTTVAATPGAVGFVDVYSITSAVGVLKIDGKSPLEPGYALHGQ